VLVGDYQHVKAGDTLIEIDNAEYAAHVAQAEASVRNAEAAIRNLDSRIELQHHLIAEAEAGRVGIKADRDRATSERDRQQALARGNWSTAQKVETAVADAKKLEAHVVEKEAEIAAVRQQLSVLQTQTDQANAELDSRRAELDIARIALGYTQINAPVDGVASASGVREGQYVKAGAQVISIVPLPHLYVQANYKETQLARVRPGQLATVTVDAFPGTSFSGRITRLSPATGSEFSLLPPDNATGNFTKVAQRVTVRIEIEPTAELAELLRPGMSVIATIHTDQASSDSLGAAASR
jgi:membrane fusion protein (multidrug efflux system)